MTQRQHLASLPDDILYLILTNLDTARDVATLGSTCRTLYHLIQNDGWRIFVRTRFPSLSVPAPVERSDAPNPDDKCQANNRHDVSITENSLTWRQVAESLTWQARCWDRRSLQFQALLPHINHGHRDGQHHSHGSSTIRSQFLAVVDAHFDSYRQREVVVWGAGEDVVARYRERQGPGRASKTSWHRLVGREIGLSPGVDDVNAIKVVPHGNGYGILVGRHNGQLALLSGDPDKFGEEIALFSPALDVPDLEINSLDVLDISESGKRLIAVATKSSVKVYGLPEDVVANTAPLENYNLKEDGAIPRSARVGCAKWMEQGASLALSLVGCKDALRYLDLTPDGWVCHSAAKNERVRKQFDAVFDGTVCPNSLEPVYMSGSGRGTRLLLSAWRDGTIRLQDLRTPSAFDTIYQDNVDPWSNAEALMAYGTERFVTGGGEGPTVKIFDFRWPKNYYHTSGLHCLPYSPFPNPHQPFLKVPTDGFLGRARCGYLQGLSCHWHELSKRLYYRPNAKYFLSGSLRSLRNSSVWSLARGSDVSPNFYIGISGGVIEATLEPCPNTYPPDIETVDPNFGFQDWRASASHDSGYRSKHLVPSMMEIGDGYSFSGNDRSILLSNLLRHQGPREWSGFNKNLMKHHRLDNGYQDAVDFDLIKT